MKSSTNPTFRVPGLKLLAVAAAASLGSLAAFGSPGVLPPGSTPYGKTHSQWQSAWYQWAYSLPVTANPLFDTADCSAGQSGSVWFLGGNFTGAPEVRTCTIPTGTALFFPLLNYEYDNAGCADSACPPTNLSTDDRLAAINPLIDSATDISCTIDGKSVQGLSDPTTTPFRTQSVFNYTVPADPNNFLDWELVSFCASPSPGCYAGGATIPDAVAAGIYVMLPPLSNGKHTIHFHGVIGGFVEDITYHLTVM